MATREPRELVPSKGLLRALNACGGTQIRGLAGARRKHPRLSLIALERLEREIKTRLHDDILVLLALRDPVASRLTGIHDVNSIADTADDHSAPEGWVCISSVYSDPVGELVAGAHGGPYLDIAVPREPEGDEATVLVAADGFGAIPADEGSELLGAFIERVLFDAKHGEHRDGIVVGASTSGPLHPPPTLVPGRELRAPSSRGGRVVHPKFGIGEVMERIGDGDQQKIAVRFEDGQRTLLARFVTPVDPDDA